MVNYYYVRGARTRGGKRDVSNNFNFLIHFLSVFHSHLLISTTTLRISFRSFETYLIC